MKSGREDASVKPQVLEQSYNKPENCSLIWINDFSKPSKIRQFLSCHNVHIKQSGTRFQTPEKCLSNHLYQPKSKLITLAGITQWILKVWRTKNHKAEAISQWRRRWSRLPMTLTHTTPTSQGELTETHTYSVPYIFRPIITNYA